MTDKEKAEWIGIDESDVNGSVRRFKEKMEQIGIRHGDLSEMTEAFMEVWKFADKTKEKGLGGINRIKIR